MSKPKDRMSLSTSVI